MDKMKAQLMLLAEYNTWMNRQLYQVARQLPDESLNRDKKAFFGSILGSFNHILVGDLIWLRRFAQHPCAYSLSDALSTFPIPERLNQLVYEQFDTLWRQRSELDQVIEQWIKHLDEHTLTLALSYRSMEGTPYRRQLINLLMHFFTHQVHHRGQITTLLSQEGLDFGETDLLLTLPNEPEL
ncbi:MAG: DinB family protein [Thiofilum sp.]|uniref:DinB family protein n=1 Tax=Thiofilum sp. TaxID=2212733 RepID=UPI0025FFE36D|nr:DinB family protein [Thiofilum sp.]MBK8454856.1 DinB family protein [Thiofilum sp.]